MQNGSRCDVAHVRGGGRLKQTSSMSLVSKLQILYKETEQIVILSFFFFTLPLKHKSCSSVWESCLSSSVGLVSVTVMSSPPYYVEIRTLKIRPSVTGLLVLLESL